MKEKSYDEIQNQIYKELEENKNIKGKGRFSFTWWKKYIRKLELKRKFNNEEAYSLMEKVNKKEEKREEKTIREVTGVSTDDISKLFPEEENESKKHTK